MRISPSVGTDTAARLKRLTGRQGRLSPSEGVIIMETLDSDGSGDIDENEFINFWNKSVDLYTGLSVTSPVLDRGIPDSLSCSSDSV